MTSIASGDIRSYEPDEFKFVQFLLACHERNPDIQVIAGPARSTDEKGNIYTTLDTFCQPLVAGSVIPAISGIAVSQEAVARIWWNLFTPFVQKADEIHVRSLPAFSFTITETLKENLVGHYFQAKEECRAAARMSFYKDGELIEPWMYL